MSTPTIRALAIFPVKDKAGRELADVVIESEGLVGDRRKKRPVHLVGTGLTAEEVRANIFLDAPEDELTEWVGRELLIGEVVLAVTEVPSGCPGVYATVRTPGRVFVGQAVLARP